LTSIQKKGKSTQSILSKIPQALASLLFRPPTNKCFFFLFRVKQTRPRTGKGSSKLIGDFRWIFSRFKYMNAEIYMVETQLYCSELKPCGKKSFSHVKIARMNEVESFLTLSVFKRDSLNLQPNYRLLWGFELRLFFATDWFLLLEVSA